MNLYFIRHWKVENNIKKLLNWGWSNEFLDQSFIYEFFEPTFISNLINLNIDVIYSSWLNRAIQTSEIIKKILSLKSDIFIDNRLNEQYYWDLEWMEVEKIYKINWITKENISHYYRDNNETWESWDDFLSRISEFYVDLKKYDTLANKNVLIVAHGWTYRATMSYLKKLTINEALSNSYSIKNLWIVDLNFS